MVDHDFITLSKNAKDLTNKRFGKLIALGPVHRNKHKCIIWLCKCDCGRPTYGTAHSLISSHKRSCGCLQKETIVRNQTTHGLSRHRFFFLWYHMINRCENPANKHYKNYGGRGISVCSEWKDSLDRFLSYISELSNYAKKGYSIDRIDNNGNYEPGNLKWSTQTEQNRNRRSSRLLTYVGVTQCLSAWSIETGINESTIFNRLRRGWDIEKTLTFPIEKQNKRHPPPQHPPP